MNNGTPQKSPHIEELPSSPEVETGTPRFAVDELRTWPSGRWCHLVTDDWTPEGLEALHRFAESIGVKRTWFQDPPGRPQPHYDLRPSKRARAVQAGAVEITGRELAATWLRRGRESLLRSGSDRWTAERHQRFYGKQARS